MCQADQERITELTREIRRLSKELEVVKRRKAVIRQVNLDRLLKIDSNLHRLVIETMINVMKFYKESKEYRKEDFPSCPISDDAIKFTSIYLRVLYLEKEDALKKQFNFKQDQE